MLGAFTISEKFDSTGVQLRGVGSDGSDKVLLRLDEVLELQRQVGWLRRDDERNRERNGNDWQVFEHRCANSKEYLECAKAHREELLLLRRHQRQGSCRITLPHIEVTRSHYDLTVISIQLGCSLLQIGRTAGMAS